MARGWLLVSFFVAAICAPAPALACKCAPPPPPADALRDAAAVFEARVMKLTELSALEVVVELNVVRSWKNAASEHILVRTRRDSAACGIAFVANESYLVYATEASSDPTLPPLIALSCGRTRPMGEAEEDLATLGVGVVPVSGQQGDLPADAKRGAAAPEKPAAGGCASCSALGAGRATAPSAELSLALLGLLWMVRWRRRRFSS